MMSEQTTTPKIDDRGSGYSEYSKQENLPDHQMTYGVYKDPVLENKVGRAMGEIIGHVSYSHSVDIDPVNKDLLADKNARKGKAWI